MKIPATVIHGKKGWSLMVDLSSSYTRASLEPLIPPELLGSIAVQGIHGD